jgi:hypothetical protein
MDAQLQSGNISLKGKYSNQVLLFSHKRPGDLQRQLADMQKDIHILLQLPLIPNCSCCQTNKFRSQILSMQLLDSTRTNRPDLQLAQTNLLSQHFSHQKHSQFLI